MTASRLVTAIVLLVAITAVPVTAAGASAGQSASEMPCSSGSSYPLTPTDATGTTVTVDASPDSIVALQPSDARTIYRIGAEDRLVGLPHTQATRGLDRGDRANIGTGFNINHERIIDLDPDVVLAANVTKKADIEQLRAANISVYHFEKARSIADVERNVRLTGQLVDECDGATSSVEWMDRRLAIVERAVEGVDRPLAYYELGGGYTAGSETFQHDVLQTAGLENVGARAGVTGWAQLSSEVLIAEDPEWIVYPDRTETPDIADAATSITAYQNERFVPVDANNMSQPAPQVVYAIEEIVRTVHPEAYQAALDAGQGEESETTPNDTASESKEDGADTDAEESTNALPGFGMAGAFAALLASVAVLARRR
jgi:iron complex transport system substrate-binding protein